jgi:murein DD-endopeptidase MepM/ murein hydrolase activator NlpD
MRSVRNLAFIGRVGLALILIILIASAAQAQTAFQTPVWGGSIGHPFNDTKAAKPGWYHTGIDYWGPNKQSTYILASNVGVVYAVLFNGSNDHGLGNCVIIKHNVVISSNGSTYPYYTLYAHLDSFANIVQSGQRVSRGQIIGTMGSTGYGQRYYWGKTPHLHFEVKTAGVFSNPYGRGTYWGYTPTAAENYGYINPASVIGKWTAK